MTAQPLDEIRNARRWVQRYRSVADWTTAPEPTDPYARRPAHMAPGGWTFGAIGSAAATVEAVRAGTATPALWEAFKAERDRLEPALNDLAARLPSTRKRRRFREDGAELNIDRLMGGAPEHWERRERGARRQTVKLGLNVAVSAGNGEATFIRNAARTAAAADLLQRLGYAVELHAVAAGWDPRGLAVAEYALVAPVKRAEDPLDVGRVLCLGLPGLVRWCLFGMYERDGMVPPYKNCRPPSTETREALGVDYLIGRDWIEGEQSDRLEGVRQVLAAVQGIR